MDFKLIDHFEKVTDKDAAVYTRKMAREEGIFAGNSCGAAIKGVLQLKHHFSCLVLNQKQKNHLLLL